MCSRNYSLCRTETALQAAIESPKSTVGTDDRSRCLAKSLTGPIVGLECITVDHFSAGDLIMRRQAKPGAEVLLGREFGHVRTDLGDDRLSQTLPIQAILTTQGGSASLTLTPTPIFLYAGE